ncbi:MAG: shikimate dehydrogenase [Acidimicrobiia bacterium]|nr:shikimate dehydrogenase [Acidimicrobiia bacterium]
MAGRPHAITGHTCLAAVIGHPVQHSLSPRIHNAAFAAAGLDWTYVAFEVDPANGAAAVDAMRTLGIGGLSVTMPHKAAAAMAADERTPTVERLGVANCLFWRNGRIVADSTDGDGFVAAFEHGTGQDLAGRSIGVIGAGGAARSIIEALGRNRVADIVVVNRSETTLADAVALAVQARAGTADDLATLDIIVNTTPVGMAGGSEAGRCPIDADLISASHSVVDIVYNPLETPLLAAAAERGATVQGGVPMLVHQAALAFRRWTDREPPIETMMAAVADQLG